MSKKSKLAVDYRLLPKIDTSEDALDVPNAPMLRVRGSVFTRLPSNHYLRTAYKVIGFCGSHERLLELIDV